MQAKALKVIRDQRLYRETHDTFEDYCQERWGYGANYAHKVIQYGTVMENLSKDEDLCTISTQISELATRQVASLPPEQQRQVVKLASNNGTVKPTAGVERAKSRRNWIIGQDASEWTRKYAKGRTDADFGALIGASHDKVRQCRVVYETYADVYDSSRKISWTHYRESLNWPDASECLQWAETFCIRM